MMNPINLKTEKQIEVDKIKVAAENITQELIEILNRKNVSFQKISWKSGKEHYILSVATEFGTRFCRFGPKCLLSPKDPMTRQINSFLISKLVNKLVSLKK